MPITLITGLPGHGKTLYALSRYRHIHEAPPKGEARPVFHASGQSDKAKRSEIHGIPDLALPWDAIDPLQWAQCPANSVVVIDEAQFVFGPRAGRSEPPEYVAQLATHRHLGVDLVLITQHPKLLDPFVLRLVDRHFHVIRKFGTAWATVHEFANGVRETVDRSRKDSIRHDWRYPKDVFSLYKSAEVHTVKARIPAKVFVMLGMIPLAIGFGLYAAYRLNPANAAHSAKPGTGQSGSDQAASAPGAASAGAPGQRPSSAGVWASSLTPRVAGLPHTAPAYDRLTVPVEAPYPAYCVDLGPHYQCKCYSQRGTNLDAPRATCESIAKGGFFAYWTADRRQSLGAPSGGPGTAQTTSFTEPAGPAAQPSQPPGPAASSAAGAG